MFILNSYRGSMKVDKAFVRALFRFVNEPDWNKVRKINVHEKWIEVVYSDRTKVYTLVNNKYIA